MQLVTFSPNSTGLADLVMAYNADGRPEVFVVFSDGQVFHRWQWRDGSWSYWASLGGSVVAHGGPTLAVANEADGSLDVFALWSDGSVRAYVQNGPDGGWSAGWRYVGTPDEYVPENPAKSIEYGVSVARNLDGRLEVYVNGATFKTQTASWFRWAERLVQSVPGGGFGSEWAYIGPIGADGPSGYLPPYSGRDTAGRLLLFTLNEINDGTHQMELWYAQQPTPNSWG